MSGGTINYLSNGGGSGTSTIGPGLTVATADFREAAAVSVANPLQQDHRRAETAGQRHRRDLQRPDLHGQRWQPVEHQHPQHAESLRRDALRIVDETSPSDHRGRVAPGLLAIQRPG